MRKGLSLLLKASALTILAGAMFGPIYAVFVQEIGGNLLTAGSAYAVFAIVTGVLIFAISRWEDHVKHKEFLIIFGYGLGCLGFLGYILITEPIHLFIVQIIFGIAGAVGTPAFDGMYSKFLERGKFVSEWGLWESMFYIISAIGALTGGFIAENFGFRFLFGIMLVIALIGFFVSLLLHFEKYTLHKEVSRKF